MSGSRVGWAIRHLNAQVPLGLALFVVIGLAIALAPPIWVLLFVVGGVAVLAVLVWPQLGVLLVVVAIPFGSLRQVRVGAMNVGVTEMLLALVLMAWLLRMLARREFTVKLPPLTALFSLFIFTLGCTSLGSTSFQHSVKELVKWGEVLALYILVANEMTGRWQRPLLFVLLGTGALAALHGIYQFLFQVGPEEFVLFGRFMRAYGTFEQPNPYAGYLGLTLPLAVALVIASIVPMRERVSTKWLVWAGGTGALMILALAMSWSRGAWLGIAAAIGTMVVAIAARSSRAAMLGAGLLAVLAYLLLAGGLGLLPRSVVQRFSDFMPYLTVVDVRGVEVTDANFAVLERMAHWQSAIAMWADHPWLGVGIGNYGVQYASYALPQWPDPLGHAHNYYLNIGAEAGLLGLISYLILWGSALLQSWRAVRHAWNWTWGVALGVLGVLVHLSVHSFFDNLFVHAMYLQVAILLGMIAFAGDTSRDAKAAPHTAGGLYIGGSV